MNHLAAVGFGYTARALAARLDRRAWQITGTSRGADDVENIRAAGFNGVLFNPETDPDELVGALASATHLLVSAAPTTAGDPLLGKISDRFNELVGLRWIGYLSTVGVYGDRGGDWVDEDTAPEPSSERGRRRLNAENSWRFAAELHANLAMQVFRLPGIYGPGRSGFDKLRDGNARRIIKPGQVFNRMHVDDIAGALLAAIDGAEPGFAVYNLSDDEPAPPQDVVAFAARLMGVAAPPEVTFDAAEMTPMARSFYGENKRVSNKRMKSELGYQLKFPTYREGLADIWRHESER
ncbi:MAG: SDR family oxidoreductase [Alphaproteobacteria bacterium]|nr:SDR family oxidoreductase [Alphaproteobacteria bacterium]